MAQPARHSSRTGPQSNLVPPEPKPDTFVHRHPVEQVFARKSYGGPLGLKGRKRQTLQKNHCVADENAITSTTTSISLAVQVLSNHLIWNIIGCYLGLSDLKICRLVSHLFNFHILNSTNFKDRALVTLTPHLLRREEFGTTHISWKHISLPVQKVCEKSECAQVHLHDDSWIIPMLSEVESLILVKGHPCPVIPKAISPSPTWMMKASKKLKDLTVDERIFSFFFFTKFTAQLSRLEAFKIATKRDKSYSKPLNDLEKMLNVTKHLKVFKTSFKMDPDAGRDFLEWNIETISLLIQQNLHTMEILKPRDPLFWTDEFLECEPIIGMTFPHLTSVRICVTSQNGFDVIKFIKAQPKLTQLTLDSFEMGDSVFPNLVLEAVAEISVRLKKLHVKAREFRDLQLLKWEFLKRSNIQDLSIWPCKDRLYSVNAIKGAEFVPELLNYLPSKVKRVRLQSGFVGLYSLSGNYPVIRIDLGRIDPQALTCLCLSRMASVITDATLEYIFRNFFMLKELHLSDLNDSVTDYGFTGVNPSSHVSEFSIQNLKGLQNLTVRRCRAITNFSLLKAFKFQELRYLDVSCNPNINVQGCIAVAQQNPSLEVFVNDHMSELPPQQSVRRKTYPRLKILRVNKTRNFWAEAMPWDY